MERYLGNSCARVSQKIDGDESKSSPENVKRTARTHRTQTKSERGKNVSRQVRSSWQRKPSHILYSHLSPPAPPDQFGINDTLHIFSQKFPLHLTCRLGCPCCSAPPTPPVQECPRLGTVDAPRPRLCPALPCVVLFVRGRRLRLPFSIYLCARNISHARIICCCWSAACMALARMVH